MRVLWSEAGTGLLLNMPSINCGSQGPLMRIVVGVPARPLRPPSLIAGLTPVRLEFAATESTVR